MGLSKKPEVQVGEKGGGSSSLFTSLLWVKMKQHLYVFRAPMWAPSSPVEFRLYLPRSRRSRWSRHADFLKMRWWRCRSWHPPRLPAKHIHWITAYQGTETSSFSSESIQSGNIKPHPGNRAFRGQIGRRNVALKKKKGRETTLFIAEDKMHFLWGTGEKKSCIKFLQRISLEHRTGTILRCQLGA